MQGVLGDRDRPIGALFSELAHETGTLVKQEVELAKVEMTDKAKSVAREGAIAGAGVAFAYAGALAVFAGFILALATLIPLWAACFVVGGIALAVGAGLGAYAGKAMKRIDPRPRETIRTLEEDKRWITAQAAR
jgi:hypothetical protein